MTEVMVGVSVMLSERSQRLCNSQAVCYLRNANQEGSDIMSDYGHRE